MPWRRVTYPKWRNCSTAIPMQNSMRVSYNDFKRWLDGLPADWFTEYPALGLARAGYMAFTGAFDACLNMIDEVERQSHRQRMKMRGTSSPGSKRSAALSPVLPMTCLWPESLADQALRELPEGEDGFLPNIYSALGDTYRRNGLWQKAYQCYLKALDYPHAPAIQVISANIYGAIADLNLQQGQLRAAAKYWEKALFSIQEQENWGRYPLPLAGWIYIRLAELEYEWNRLEEARRPPDARSGTRQVRWGCTRSDCGGAVASAPEYGTRRIPKKQMGRLSKLNCWWNRQIFPNGQLVLNAAG